MTDREYLSILCPLIWENIYKVTKAVAGSILDRVLVLNPALAVDLQTCSTKEHLISLLQRSWPVLRLLARRIPQPFLRQLFRQHTRLPSRSMHVAVRGLHCYQKCCLRCTKTCKLTSTQSDSTSSYCRD